MLAKTASGDQISDGKCRTDEDAGSKTVAVCGRMMRCSERAADRTFQ